VATRKEKEDWVMKCGKEKGSFLFATLHHTGFRFLSRCHTSSPSLPFPFSLPHFITQSSLSFGKEKGKGRLGDEEWQKERKRKTW
jgi:hypothetical protein